MTQHPEDPSTPGLWFHRFGVALGCTTVDELGGYEPYDAFVYRLGEADGPDDLTPADRELFERLEARANAGASPFLQYEHRGDWQAEDAAEDDTAGRPKAEAKTDVVDDQEWVGL